MKKYLLSANRLSCRYLFNSGVCLGLLLYLFTLSSCMAGGQETITAQEFYTNLQTPGVQLVDVRTPEEFETGYIRGAVNMDMRSPSFRQRMSSLDPKKPLALYCKAGLRSAEAMKICHDLGFRTIWSMEGGLDAWTAAGYLTEKPEKPEPVLENLTGEEYEKLVRSSKLVIVDFNATWCGPCKKVKPILEKLASEYENRGLRIVSVDVDMNKDLSNQLLVNEIPLLLFYSSGEVSEQIIGFTPEDILRQTIEKYLKP